MQTSPMDDVLSDEHFKEMVLRMHDRRVKGMEIVEWLRSLGYTFSRSAVFRRRQRLVGWRVLEDSLPSIRDGELRDMLIGYIRHEKRRLGL